jgi:hypothetical protein
MYLSAASEDAAASPLKEVSMTIVVQEHVFKIISSSSDLAEAALLQVMGTADLTTGAALLLRFTFGPQRFGRVIAIEDAGARAVIEVEGERWYLNRQSNTVNTGPEPCLSWTVARRCEGHDP